MIAQTNIRPRRRTRLSSGDRLYYIFAYTYIILLTLGVLYPLIYVVSASFSSPGAVSTGKVILWPVEPSLEGYRAVFRNPNVLTGYRNTIFYTAAGTAFNVFMTLICAYPLARRGLPHRGGITFLFSFTMLFGGGMIPNYLLMRDLKLLNTVWVMIIPGAISVYNMIVTRTFFQTNLPDELLEATRIDGCSDIRFFTMFAVPLSKAVIAVIAMQYAVGHWNSYFNAFIYLSDKKLYPLQIFLREILVQSKIDISDVVDPETAIARQGLAELLKYSLIIVATAPILCVYPFIQKYFVQGVMVGSLKG
ncbi:MAG: carbohydrate ABC transporter permease [Christensenellales bacterium]